MNKLNNYFKSLIFILVIGLSGEISDAVAQDLNHYFFNDVDTTQSYESSGFCRTLNYYWDQGIIDPDGNIYFVFVDAYNLYYYLSQDGGLTWKETQVETGYEGKVYAAMAGMTADGRLVIVFTVNEGFSSGVVPYGSEFKYTCFGAVMDGEGWAIDNIYTASTNSGLLPYGTITTKSGIVHVILHKYGWYNYGGELYECMFNPQDNTWSDLETIKIFGDRPVDHSTFYVAKLAEGENDTIVCVYSRHRNDSKFHNVEVIMKGADGWTDEEIIQDNSNYATYNKFDLDYDRHGHMYLAYFEPFGPEGPELYIAHNSVRDFEKFTVFTPQDTLRKISIHPYPDGIAYIYLNFKDSLPEIWKLSQDGLQKSEYLPGFADGDSTDVMRFHYQIPIKNNFSVLPGTEGESETGSGLFAFTNRYQGKDVNTVLPYPLVFVRADLEYTEEEPINSIQQRTGSIKIYPNPGNGLLRIDFDKKEALDISVYDLPGKLILRRELANGDILDMSSLPPGIYIIKEVSGVSSIYLKE